MHVCMLVHVHAYAHTHMWICACNIQQSRIEAGVDFVCFLNHYYLSLINQAF